MGVGLTFWRQGISVMFLRFHQGLAEKKKNEGNFKEETTHTYLNSVLYDLNFKLYDIIASIEMKLIYF